MEQDFCTKGGYIEALGYSAEPARAIIPNVKRLLDAFRKLGWQVYHTREGWGVIEVAKCVAAC